jgi:hypothetical protein
MVKSAAEVSISLRVGRNEMNAIAAADFRPINK